MRVAAWDIVFLLLFVSSFSPSTALEPNAMASVDIRLLASLLPLTFSFFSSPANGYVTPSMDCTIADVVFLVDSSGSIGIRNWRLMQNFVRDMIRGLSKTTTNIRFGVVSFSGSPRVEFDLNDYHGPDLPMHRVSQMHYRGGWTNIADALKMARERVFPSGRTAATKVVILLTDGKPTVKGHRTESEAQKVKNLKAHVLTVGITRSVDRAQLRRIASTTPDAEYVANFQQLHGRVSELVKRACPQTKSGDLCNKADIGLIVDSSGSISSRDWNYGLKFLEDIIRNIKEGHDVRFGLVDFSTRANLVYNFRNDQDVNKVVRNTRRMRYYGGSTNIADGLKLAQTGLFNDNRPKTVRIAILMTDGKPTVKAYDTDRQARYLKNKGVHLVPVGVTKHIDENLLKRMANNPKDVITSPDFKSLHSYLNNVIGTACGPTRYCEKSDVVLVIDSSGSIGRHNWRRVLNLLEDTIKIIDKDGTDVHFGLIEFSNYAKVVLNLRPRSLNQVIWATKHMKFIGGGTNMASAFEIARKQVFTTSTRPNAAKLLVMITDGYPNSRTNSLRQAIDLKENGIRIINIGVTGGVDAGHLKKMASSPEDVFLSPNFKSLAHEMSQLIEALCYRGSMKYIE